MYRPSGSGRQDVKARTMKFAALDPDIASKYEDLDEEEGAAYRYKTTRMPNRDPRTGPRDQRFGGRSSQLLPKKMIGLIENHINKKDQSMMRTAGAGSSRRDMINSITVKNASRSGKDHILKLLANSVDQFLPFMTKIDENGDLSFLITNEDDAQAVCAMSKRIADKHNPSMKYAIYKRRIPAPYDMLNAASRQVIEEILKSRFNQFANSLDLSNFQNDPIFDKKRETPRGIFHNNVMVAVANLVARYYSGIRGIRLNNNNLRSLDFVSCLVYAAPNVVELDLANNAFSRIDELGKLSGWQLESVHFENNEFTTSFGDNFAAYTNAVHQYFPRVSYLDGIQVHVAADASTSESTSLALPKYKPGYYTDDSLRKMAENFLLEYFGFYDGPNGEQTRQQLINAYDPNSTFSYAACMLPDTRYVERQEDFHQQYIRNSHNIITQQKWQSFRDRLIFRGPMDIAVALSKLPPSEHVKQSFLLDFNLVSNNLMVLTLQGIFRDGKDNIGGETSGSKFKFFVRQFAIVPKAEGLAILSDMLQITPVSTQRMEHYNNLLKNAATQQMSQLQMDGMAPPPPSPQTHPEALLLSSSTSIKQEASSSSSLWSTPPPNNNPNDPAFRAELVKQFCLFTGMRPEWSEKCLQDCAWNWEDARAAFGCIRGKIPPEAFAS